MTRWSIYMVRCGDGSLYTGVASDVRRRLSEHRRRGGRGAKYLRGRGPLRLVLERPIGARGGALKVESWIKSLSKARKEELVRRGNLLERLAAAVSGRRKRLRRRHAARGRRSAAASV